jgi:2',3'-cyclic-nucleotide 2'-phosphodiesterase (5'-nucleotidase family)
MKKRFIVKLTILVAMLISILYFCIPNVNIILSNIYKDDYKHIEVFYTNDSHGHIMQDRTNGVMGMALVQSLIDKNTSADDNVLLLDAGDTFYGSNETDLNNGKPMVDIMNKMNYAAMTVGNHEFDFGFEQTMSLEKETNFPILSANLYKDNKRIFKPYTIVNIEGINIGIIGLSTEDTLTRTKPEYVKDLTIKNDNETLDEILPEVKAKSDYIILLGHEHSDKLEEIGKEYKDINLIIAGHDHEVINGLRKSGNSYITSSGCFLNKLGKIDLVFKDGKPVYANGSLISSKSKSNQDAEVLSIENSYHDKIAEQLNEKIGETKSPLGDCAAGYYQETNFGNVIADAMRNYMKTDLTIQNGGGIRINIPKGDLNLYKINEAFPFINYVISVEMTGRDVKEALEHGLEKYPSGWNGGFPQVSGMKYVFDAAKPSGKRLMNVYVGDKEIEDDKTYTVATNDYLYQGGDGYDVIKDSKLIYNSGLLIKDVFKQYVEENKVIEPKVDGRIEILNLKTN